MQYFTLSSGFKRDADHVYEVSVLDSDGGVASRHVALHTTPSQLRLPKGVSLALDFGQGEEGVPTVRVAASGPGAAL